MIKDPKCQKCGFAFMASSRQFYCCDSNRKYCIICRRDNCPTCGRMINKEVQVPRCRQCYTVEKNPSLMLKQSACDSYYCGKCVVTKLLSKIDKYSSTNVMFPCGHALKLDVVQNFLTQFCSICGNKYDFGMDYELLNGAKCCFLCVKYENQKVQDLLINCMNCGDGIRRMDQAGTLDNDFILCSKCTTFSQMEERHFSDIQSNKIQEKPNSKEVPIVKMSPVENKDVQQNKGKLQAQDQQSRVSNQKQYKKPEKDQKYSNKMETTETKQKNKDPMKNLKKTILEKFPSEAESREPKLKKHMSMETYIEKMKIEIQPELEKTIECNECTYQFQEKEDMVIEENKRYCRLCYLLINNAEFLGFGGRKMDDSMEESRRKFKSNQKRTNYLPVPDDRANNKFGKQSGHFESYRQGSTSKPVSVAYQPSSNPYRQECTICKKSEQSVIRTVRDGNVCFSCYYKKKN